MRLKADRTVDTILDVDYAELSAGGKSVLLFDLDRTLGPRRATALPSRAIRLLESLAEKGFRIGILSNRRRPKGDPVISEMAARYELLHTAGKPRRRGYVALLDRFDATPADAVMIGDKWITDIVGAKRLGILAIRVRGPVSE